MPPLYLFPTGLAYHGVCCAAEVLTCSPPPATRTRITTTLSRLSRMAPGVTGLPLAVLACAPCLA